MKEVVNDKGMVAACGLYCGACKVFLKDSCPGCNEDDAKKHSMSGWHKRCPVRSCCRADGVSSCAGCQKHSDPKACSKFNSFIAKIFGFIFRSDRAACVRRIREIGPEAFASEMAEARQPTIKRK